MFLTLAVVIGGIDMVTQAVALAKKPHIIIGMQCVLLALKNAMQINAIVNYAKVFLVNYFFTEIDKKLLAYSQQ